jgi:hypothetical protein
MSLINDALKQARQHPPAEVHPPTHPPLPPLQPVEHQRVDAAGWLIPAIVIFLIVAAVFCIGWVMANRTVNSKPVIPVATMAPAPLPVEPAPVAVAAPPAVTPVAASAPAPAPEPPVLEPVSPPRLPVLQGIFYSPTAPSAIVDGKTVRVGDKLKSHRVQEITKSTVTVVDAAGRTTKLVMGN